MNRRRPLLPPVTPHGMPRGLARGGVLEAGWVPTTYIDAARPTVPTNSPAAHDVSTDVFLRPISFVSSETVRQVTGFGQVVESADVAPIRIRPGGPVQTPHGRTEGGIFGGRQWVNGYGWGRRVPQVRTTDYALMGCGMSPDGLGRCW